MSSKNFHEIYANCYKSSLLFAKSYVHDHEIAEDIASESIIKLWHLMSNGTIETPERLLVTIVKNKALDHLRHKSIQAVSKQNIQKKYQRELNLRISSLEACNPEDIFSTEIIEIIKRTIATLPKQTQIIFKLSRFENLSQKEIALKVGLSTKSVEYHISNALKVLRKELSDYLPIILSLSLPLNNSF